MDYVIFDGELPMGDGRGATAVFAQDFRLPRCELAEKKLRVECRGVEILGEPRHRVLSSHSVYLDRLPVGRIEGDRTELAELPDLDAGLHRVEIHVSTFPALGLRDDFSLTRVVLTVPD